MSDTSVTPRGGKAAALAVADGELGRISAASLISESGLALGYLIIFGSLLGHSAYEWAGLPTRR